MIISSHKRTNDPDWWKIVTVFWHRCLWDLWFFYLKSYWDEYLGTWSAHKSVLLPLTCKFLLPNSNKDFALLDFCACLGCFRFSDPNLISFSQLQGESRLINSWVYMRKGIMGYWRSKMWGGGYVLTLMHKTGPRPFRHLPLAVGLWEEAPKGPLDLGKTPVATAIVVADETMVGTNDGQRRIPIPGPVFSVGFRACRRN